MRSVRPGFQTSLDYSVRVGSDLIVIWHQLWFVLILAVVVDVAPIFAFEDEDDDENDYQRPCF